MNHRHTEEDAEGAGGTEGAGSTESSGGVPVSGTGVPGVRSGHPDSLPPDEEGVREAERTDDTGDHGWKGRPGRPPRSTG
ncbi:hypothetical protein [Spirillospora sp. NPDC029432]|uniref:hypothetical protein n=1 Tax=Spirillospora sp. NPDC029432 TaxID=3154599 RepID=UPI00345641C8